MFNFLVGIKVTLEFGSNKFIGQYSVNFVILFQSFKRDSIISDGRNSIFYKEGFKFFDGDNFVFFVGNSSEKGMKVILSSEQFLGIFLVFFNIFHYCFSEIFRYIFSVLVSFSGFSFLYFSGSLSISLFPLAVFVFYFRNIGCQFY